MNATVIVVKGSGVRKLDFLPMRSVKVGARPEDGQTKLVLLNPVNATVFVQPESILQRLDLALVPSVTVSVPLADTLQRLD
jgi:hypothetical protein